MEDDIAQKLQPQQQHHHHLSTLSIASENAPNANCVNHGHSEDKPRQQRHRIKGDALQTLETYFLMNPRPSSQEIVLLGKQTGENEHRIRIWFNNRRGKHTRQAIAEETCDADLLNGTVRLSTGQLVNISMIQTGDELTLKLRDKIVSLQGRLQEVKRQQQSPLTVATQLQLLPPISSLFEHSMTRDLDQLKQSLYQLLTRVASTNFTRNYCPREVHITLKSGGEGIVRALESCGRELARPVHNHQRRHYIILGPNILRLLRETSLAEDKDCLVLCPSGYSVLVEGICVVPFINSGGQVLLRAACTLLSQITLSQQQKQE